MNSDAVKNFKKSRRSDCITYIDFDNKYGIDTSGPIRLAKDGSLEFVPDSIPNGDKFTHSNGFQNSTLGQVDLINNYLKSNFDISKFNFIDIGSGKGKILFYNQINNIGYKSLIGIEIDPELYNISLLNSQSITGPKFYNMDALEYAIPDEPVILFAFNPFSKEKWIELLSKLDTAQEIILVLICGFGELEKDTLVVLDRPELDYGFNLIHEEDLIYFYKRN